MACKPSCRLTAVAAPPAATHRKPAAEQAGRALSAGRASVMVPAGERGATMLRCSDADRVAPMRVRAGSGRPLSASALAGAAVRSATAWSMRILCAVCGRRCPSEMSESFKFSGPADAGRDRTHQLRELVALSLPCAPSLGRPKTKGRTGAARWTRALGFPSMRRLMRP